MAVATWRTHSHRQGQLTLLVGAGVAVLVVGVATGVFSAAVEAAAITLLVLAIPTTLVRGLVRLVGERGATLQAIAGALSIYLMLGLLFASVIAFVAEVQDRPYFAQGDVSNGDRVYYSFTVLTTTGFGDYTAATLRRPRAGGPRDARRAALPGDRDRSPHRPLRPPRE